MENSGPRWSCLSGGLDAGAKVADLCRKHGMSDATFYKWKAKFAGMDVSQLRRLKDLEKHRLYRIYRIYKALGMDLKRNLTLYSQVVLKNERVTASHEFLMQMLVLPYRSSSAALPAPLTRQKKSTALTWRTVPSGMVKA